MVVPFYSTEAENDCRKMKTLYEYTKFILTSDDVEDAAKDLSYAVMPRKVANDALDLLDEMKCVDK